MDLTGVKLKGFCNGFFGRDSYDTKTIESYGRDWIVARGEDNIPVIAVFNDYNELLHFVKEWMKEIGWEV